eukprot:253979-Heterocapsa_arctica.AAC.1
MTIFVPLPDDQEEGQCTLLLELDQRLGGEGRGAILAMSRGRQVIAEAGLLHSHDADRALPVAVPVDEDAAR